MKKIMFSLFGCMLIASTSMAFCGFYVAKAGAQLLNKKSQIIFVRDGDRSVVTMSNDFEGNVRDFAMVVPVPVVLKEHDIKVLNRDIFDKLDNYSAPRMVEYYDSNPCQQIYSLEMEDIAVSEMRSSRQMVPSMANKAIDYQVTIEAQYSVEEYDILILSAKESSGLKNWLTDNGYKIPEKAEFVLEPYIKNNLKFFVVKVNLDKMDQINSGYLRPLQISYNSDRFMLPIRLGMANSDGEQDMLVYAFTRHGRIECTNYRTNKIPTDRNIPKFIKDKNDFGEFYLSVFDKAHKQQRKNSVFLEYAWNVSPSNGVKCDPCVSPPPIFEDFAKAGVDWTNGFNGNVFFTRLHVRYAREQFPEDLFFQVTPNNENFQARYVVTIPANGDLSCDAGQRYLKDLEKRRKNEVEELAVLTDWENPRYNRYIYEYSDRIQENRNEGMIVPPGNGGQNPPAPRWVALAVIMLFVSSLSLMAFKLFENRYRLNWFH